MRKFQGFMLSYWIACESHLFLPAPCPIGSLEPKPHNPAVDIALECPNFHAPTPEHRACTAEPSNNWVFFDSGLPRVLCGSWYQGSTSVSFFRNFRMIFFTNRGRPQQPLIL